MIKKISLLVLLFTTLSPLFPVFVMREMCLHQAIILNDLNLVKKLLKKGAPIDEQNLYGNTPLHFAAYYGHTKIVRYLIEQGANIYILNEDCEMPVYVTKKLEIVNLLLEKEWFNELSKYIDLHSEKNNPFENSLIKEERLKTLKKISLSSSLANALSALKIIIQPKKANENATYSLN